MYISVYGQRKLATESIAISFAEALEECPLLADRRHTSSRNHGNPGGCFRPIEGIPPNPDTAELVPGNLAAVGAEAIALTFGPPV
jgi:hypothetical protein